MLTLQIGFGVFKSASVMCFYFVVVVYSFILAGFKVVVIDLVVA